eukprot:COSAG05_NODE_2754_length_2682_cov_1.552846_4_plen_83_part_00
MERRLPLETPTMHHPPTHHATKPCAHIDANRQLTVLLTAEAGDGTSSISHLRLCVLLGANGRAQIHQLLLQHWPEKPVFVHG